MEYSALLHVQANILVPGGLEPRTLRLLAVRSNQLSYETRCCPVTGELTELGSLQGRGGLGEDRAAPWVGEMSGEDRPGRGGERQGKEGRAKDKSPPLPFPGRKKVRDF